jgi:signal transduction histidine kinase/DNA-binding response OmpR family regulator/HPt (histidine-containing phosphotransfer) domain-containing protein
MRDRDAMNAPLPRHDSAFLQSVIDAARSVAIIATDPAGLITLFNSGAELMLGYSAFEIVGKATPECFHYQPEVEARLREPGEKWKCPVDFPDLVVRGVDNGLPDGTRWTLVRKDGSVVTASLTVGALRDEEGKATGYVGILGDLSGQIDRQSRLEIAKRAAESASRAKSDFLAAMSHEIRTPMNGVLGMAGLLLDSELTERQRKRVETLRSSAESLLGVLNDILDFSKIEANRLELEVADFDLRKVVEDVVDLMALKAQEKDVEMLCFIEPEVPTRLQGDPNRLRQVLGNLVGNAVKFTVRGSISLTVSLAGLPDSGAIRFDVADTGIGIPECKQHLLFQPFSQADASTARKYGGTGLGLSIVAGLVKMLGGRIGFESEDGRGSTFWFTAALAPQPEARRPPALSLAGKRVLVVDDSPACRSNISRFLSYWHCIPDEAGGAEEAMRKLRAKGTAGYDAVLIDLAMPGRPGDRLAREIRAEKALRDIPLLIMTDLRHVSDGEYWRARGFAGRITKPVKQGELGGRLAAAMGYGPSLDSRASVAAPLRDRTAARKSRRLLLVEDNAVNREVALGILENLGYIADVACDGLSAISRLRRNAYAAVLADCNLPEMDGYELTRLIRLGEPHAWDPRVPVIAMTAHALAGDREKCIAAGMDDYVSKPIDPKALESVLDRWTGVEVSEVSGDTATGPAVVREIKAFDQDELIERVMGNEEIARRVASRFVADIPAQLVALSAAIAGSDGERAHAIAHSIKGAAANVSAAQMSRITSDLEHAARAGDMNMAREAWSKLSDEFDQASAALNRFAGSE